MPERKSDGYCPYVGTWQQSSFRAGNGSWSPEIAIHGGGRRRCCRVRGVHRCTPDCPLAEYFPHDRPRIFRNAHRLFGVSNILKTLDRAGPEKRREAMHCIIYESHAWDVNPANGCVAIIDDLKRRIWQADLDLRRVYAAIQAYRAAAAAQGWPVPDSDGGDPSASSSYLSSAPPPPFQFQPATGNDDDAVNVIAEASYGSGSGGGFGLPFLMYGGDQQQMMINASAPDDENIALQMPPWMMQPPRYDLASASAVADMAAGKVVPQLEQQDHRFLVDASQQEPIQPPAELDEEMSYFVDGMDGDSEMHYESTSVDSSRKKAMKAPKMEDAIGFFKL